MSAVEPVRASTNAISPPRSRFFIALALLMLAIVFAGFAPTFFLRAWFDTKDRVTGGPLPPHVMLHGVLLSAWFGLFAVQAWLVAAHRTRLHMRLGIAAVALGAAVVASGFVTIARVIPRALQGFGASSLEALPLDSPLRDGLGLVVLGDTISLLMFVGFVALAVWYRATPAVHKRLVLYASVSIIGPALSPGRPVGSFLAEILPPAIAQPPLFMFACIGMLVWHDLATRRRVEPATIWGGGAIVASIAALFALNAAGVDWLYVRWVATL
jgi:hypothetical protein